MALPGHAEANGGTFPACGDVDGDGRDEIVLGLGKDGQWKLMVVLEKPIGAN